MKSVDTTGQIWYSIHKVYLINPKGNIDMKKRIVSMLIAAVMLLSLMPFTVFAASAPSYEITNLTPEEDKDVNGGYIVVESSAEAGERVNITVVPNEGYAIDKVMYGKANAQDSFMIEGNVKIYTQDIDVAVVNNGNQVEGMTDSIPGISSDSISTPNSAAATDDSAVYYFTMPDFPVVVFATFEYLDPAWSEWEEYESGNGTWIYGAIKELGGLTSKVTVKVRYLKENEKIKQISIGSWGNSIITLNGTDIIFNWNEETGELSLPEQSTGAFQPNFSEYLMIQDLNGYTGTSGYPSYYDDTTDTFYFAMIYYISGGYFGIGYEALKIVPDGALDYDADQTNFSAEFSSDDTELLFGDNYVLVGATDSSYKTAVLKIYIEQGSNEIPAGEYPVDNSTMTGTVLSSYGIIDGKVSYSFAGNRNMIGQITAPIWFLVSGKVTVSYDGDVMTMVVAGKNSYGKDIDVTFTKTLPEKHEITDGTLDENGKVVFDKPVARLGDTVTLNVVPFDGYKLKEGTLKAVYDDGTGEKELTLTQDTAEKNKFTFTMPDAEVTVSAQFEETDETFKAVFDETTGTLYFFFDKINHYKENTAIFDDLTTKAQKAIDWNYDAIRASVKSVVIDSSLENFTALESTAHMFEDMISASDISGAEYLVVDNVTDMSYMFQNFGDNSETLNVVPNVSKWNTEKVTDIHRVFYGYGLSSTVLNKVPDVSSWKTENVTDMSYAFSNYGYNSYVLNEVPAVGGWNTKNVTDMSQMFSGYANSSTVFNKKLAVDKWNTENVTDISRIFQYYAYSSEELTSVPDISAWNTAKLTDAEGLFAVFGYVSEKLNFVLDLSSWDLSGLNNGNMMFGSAGVNAAKWKVCIPYMTGELTNTPDSWYGKNDTVKAIPASERQFTLCYPVSIDENIENGKVEVSSSVAEAGTTITITVTANEGYKLTEDSLKAVYTGESGDTELPLTGDASDETKFTFTMAADAVEVKAEFEESQIYNPETGDGSDIALWSAVLVVSFAGLAAYCVFSKKRRDNR